MSITFKKIQSSDIIVTPHKAYRSKSFTSASANAVILSGSTYDAVVYYATYQTNSLYTTNISGVTSSISPKTIDNKFQKAMHDSIYHMFYDNFNYDNLSKLGEFFNGQERQLSTFAQIISIPSKIIGDGIKRNTFEFSGSFSGSNYIIKDDGTGNLYDFGISQSLSQSINDKLYLMGEWRFIDNYRKNTVQYNNKTKYDKIYDYSKYYNTAEFTGSIIFDISDTYTPYPKFTSSEWQAIRIPHQDRYNFDQNSDFAITIFVSSSISQSYTSSHDSNVILTKNGKYKRVSIGNFKNPDPFNVAGGATGSGIITAFEDKIFLNKYPYEISIINTGSNHGKIKCTRYDGAITSSLISNLSINNGNKSIIFQKTGSLLQLYIDGLLDNSGSDITLNDTTNLSDVFIGSRGDGNMRFDGNIGLYSTRIYNKALTSQQAYNLHKYPYNSANIGNIFYSHGLAIFTSPVHTVSHSISNGSHPYHDILKRANDTSSVFNSQWNIKFSSSMQMYQNEIHCTVPAGDYNSTFNWTARKKQNGIDFNQQQEMADFVTHSEFRPYATTLGLYNDFGELLIVGSLARPIKVSDNNDLTFILRFDTDQLINTNKSDSNLIYSPNLGFEKL